MHNNLTNDRIFKTLVIYSAPIIITNVVQILFNAVDVVVLSLMAGELSVAAVGACSSLITLLLNLFMGFATGADVLIARRMGAQKADEVRRTAGTALVIGFCSGVVLMVFTLIFARQFLIWMQCQPDVLDMATVYMRIYFLGMPITMLYNFVVAILRASGDSVRPMVYMLVSGVLKIVLIVFFIGVAGLAVEGAALSTVLSNLVALILGLVVLARNKGICKIEAKNLCIRRYEFFEMLKIAIPASLSALSFYMTDVIISTTINSMSTEAMTANAIASQFDGVIYTVGRAIAIAVMTIVGQNFGAGRLDRVRKTMRIGVAYVTAVSLFLGGVFVLFEEPMLCFLNDNLTVVEIAKDRMTVLCLTYFVTSIMEIFYLSLRALDCQKAVLIVSVICGFGVRCCWIWFVWPLQPTLSVLMSAITVSSVLSATIFVFIYRNALKKMDKKFLTYV